MNGLYFIRIKWYDDCDTIECTNCAFVLGDGMADAVSKISKDFKDIISLTIEEVVPNNYCNLNAIYVPDEEYIINSIKIENDY